jgi:hypothetical protein
MTVGTEYTCLAESGGRWEILSAGHLSPQEARDELAHRFRMMEDAAADDDARQEIVAAYELLDRVRRDELRVAGLRYRVGRLERFCRVDKDGPELPLPTDPAPEAGAGSAERAPRRVIGAINVNARTGTEAALLRYELRNKTPADGTPDMQDDALRALDTHPRVVIMPTEFALAEQEPNGTWTRRRGLKPTPQAVRDELADMIRFETGARHPDPDKARGAAMLDLPTPGPERAAELCAAADLIDRDRPADFRVLGHHYRVTRTEQLIRLGADGPEPPRPSDPDPEGPPAADDD